MEQDILFFILVGFVAQFIDGSLGMAYGISATTLLLTLGIPAVQASASIHAAEIITTAASGISHYNFGNVNKNLVKKLVIPGMIGAACGALTLVWIPMEIIRPIVALYLGGMGIMILIKAYTKQVEEEEGGEEHRHNLTLLGITGGFLDSAGGGGWGSIVASTLVAKGSVPRLAVGSVNAVEFFVAFTSAFTFIFSIGIDYWKIILGLAIGGVISAPLAAYFARKIPARIFMLLIGFAIVFLSARTIYLTF